jgi:hypothetical protein
LRRKGICSAMVNEKPALAAEYMSEHYGRMILACRCFGVVTLTKASKGRRGFSQVRQHGQEYEQHERLQETLNE